MKRFEQAGGGTHAGFAPGLGEFNETVLPLAEAGGPLLQIYRHEPDGSSWAWHPAAPVGRINDLVIDKELAGQPSNSR